MKTIPNHFKEAFPWIEKPTSNMKVDVALSTIWLEKEIIRLIFEAPVKKLDASQVIKPDTPQIKKPDTFTVHKLDDCRITLIKSLETELPNAEAQINYIKAVAKCLAEAVIVTPLPKATQDWLNDINASTKKLTSLLKQEDKKNLPANWNNVYSLVSQVLKDSNISDNPLLLKIHAVLKETNLAPETRSQTHGKADLIAILNLVGLESKSLAAACAIKVHKYPQTFFEKIFKDNKLFLAYQRKAILEIAMVNQEYFSKPYDALTSYVLSCIFNTDISKQKVKKIRDNLELKGK